MAAAARQQQLRAIAKQRVAHLPGIEPHTAGAVAARPWLLRLARAVRADLPVAEMASVLVTPPPLLTESNVRAAWAIMLETGRAQWPPQPAAPVTPCACPAPLPSQESSWSQKSPKTRKHVRSRAAELWARAQLGRWNRIQKNVE
jgi:hypothetical protein